MPDEVPSEFVKLLESREGFRTVVYLDSLGKPTCGMGHRLLPDELITYPVGSTVPANVLEGWVESDTFGAYVAAKSQARQIGSSDPRLINALAYVSFQLGDFWFKKFPKTWAHLVAHQWKDAANEIQISEWYKQTPVRVHDFQAALRSLDIPPNTIAATQTEQVT